MFRLVAVSSVVVILMILSWQPAGGRPPAPLKPINLKDLNTEEDEDDPHLSYDGLRLLYVTRSNEHWTLMSSTREQLGQLWPAGKPFEVPDPDADNRGPFLTADNHDLYYASKIIVKAPKGEAQPPANFDIVHSIKVGRRFTGGTPVPAVCTKEDELFPWLTADGKEMYFSRKTKEGWRLLVAGRQTNKEPFGEPREVKELPLGFHHGTVSKSGLAMYLQGPLEKDRWGLFRSTRTGLKQRWGEPLPLDTLNSPEAPTGDMSPSLSRDGSRLYFVSDRPGGKGKRDLWMIDTIYLTTKKPRQ